MNYLDAAYNVLRAAGEPLHYVEIAERAIARGLIKPQGKTPEATMGSRLYVDTKKEDSQFKRASKGYFTLAGPGRSDGISGQVRKLNDRTRRRLHELLRGMPAEKFETLVGELLIALGFDENTVEVTDFSGDGGIDVRGVLKVGGIADVNAAVQVKRWKKNIQKPMVQKVRGSLTTHEQGIIITTSGFSKGAQQEANAVGKTPISLVDGEALVALLIKHSIGVNKESHTVLSLDDEYWAEFVEEAVDAPVVEKKAVEIAFPLEVVAKNDAAITARLIDREGQILFRGKVYGSPSTAGKDATGWKSCNGWKFWQYQDPVNGTLCLIDDLRITQTP